MPNEENMVAPEEQVQEDAGQAAPQEEPKDLSEAFKVLRANEQAATSSSVEPAEQPNPKPEPQQEEQSYDAANVQQYAGDTSGGFADELQSVNYGAYAQGLVEDIGMQAGQAVMEEFKKQGIQKFNTQMLYQRDENTGEVTFVNPEKPSRPFESREEAQRWCDSMNKDIDAEFKRMVQEKRIEMLNAAGPSLRLLQFAPKFEQMSALEQDIFDDIIAGSEVYNASGEVIGYNTDLDAAAARAKQFARKYGGMQQAQQAAPQQSSGPAVDMKSSSSSAQGKQDVKEPTTLEEAMKMLNSNRKGK